MIVDRPQRPNGLCFVTDARLKFDRELQEERGGSPVFSVWGFGNAALGKANWAGVTRVALYDFGEDTEALRPEWARWAHDWRAAHPKKSEKQAHKLALAKQRLAIREELREFLRTEKFRCTVVLQTRGAEQKSKEDFGDAKGLKGTTCWDALGAPDSLVEMSGCVWDSRFGPVMPLINPINYEKVYGELIRRQLRGAWALATGKERVFRPEPAKLYYEPRDTLAGLRHILRSALAGKPVAVDIESYSPQDLITAIGLSDGEYSVSVPWDTFAVYGADRTELGFYGAGGPEEALTREILASGCAKVFHNYTYDVPFLERRGVPVRGALHDTMAMHGVVYKQWRHGLQRATSGEFLIPPWKSEYNPKHDGLTKDDPESWILDPHALRHYNTLDSWYTWHLAQALAWKVGIKL